MRRISINARAAHDDETTDETEIVLIKITHPDLDEPVRLSTDPTERLSLEPLAYGTRSKWQTTDKSPFMFVLLSVMVPDDKDDAPAAATLVLEAVDNRMVDILRSTTERATVDMAVVLASSPDLVEAEWFDMRLVSASGDASEITLQISKEAVTAEPWPAARMTKARFPGLHK